MLDEIHPLYYSVSHFQTAEIKTHCFRLFSKSQVVPLACASSANGKFIHKKAKVFTEIVLKFQVIIAIKNNWLWGFPGGAVVENLPANAGDTGSSTGLGRSHMPWSN